MTRKDSEGGGEQSSAIQRDLETEGLPLRMSPNQEKKEKAALDWAPFHNGAQRLGDRGFSSLF